MEKICGIYKITNTFNNKFYIGSSADILRRYYLHLWSLRKNKHSNQKLQHSFNKHGEKVFLLEIVEESYPEQLLIREQFWVDSLKACLVGYNINGTVEKPPSWLGKKHSLATKLKIGAKSKGKKLSNEQKRAISKVHKGKNIKESQMQFLREHFSGTKNSMYGRTPFDIWKQKYGYEEANKRLASWKANIKKGLEPYKGDNSPSKRPEVRAKLSLKNKGRKLWSEGDKLRMSLERKGRKASIQTKQLMSARRKGENNGSSKLSNEDRKYIKKALISGTGATFLARKYGVTRRTIYNARNFKESL